MGDKTVMIKVEQLLKIIESNSAARLKRVEDEHRKATDAIRVKHAHIEKRVGSLERSRLFILGRIKAIYGRLRGRKKINRISEKMEPDEAAEFEREMLRRMSDGDK